MTDSVNPVKRLVGRLFLWFWLTLLVTAIVAIAATRLWSDTISLSDPEPAVNAALSRISGQINSDRTSRLRLDSLLRRASRGIRGEVVAFNVQTGEFIKANGPPLRPGDAENIERLSGQRQAMSLHQGIVHITGPVATQHRGKVYQLFVLRLDRHGPEPYRLALLAITALCITALLAYVFARSLVRPILSIQKAAGALASGQLDARVSQAATRQDEIGTLARDFNTMASQLEAMLLAQKRLLADISHELRSPLTRLQMAVGIAHQQHIDAQVIDRIEREAECMEALIQQLLTLSRAEAGTLQREQLSVRELLSELLTDASFEANSLGKELHVSPVPDVQITVSTDLLRRATENVIRNALHYASHDIHIEVQVTDTSWTLIISDDGPGLTEQQCEHIFTAFYRVSAARERGSGGVGLGLSIAKAAVEMHDGQITAHPHANGGLRVTLSFPR
ncbi:ATP-binding protein [Alteromonas halophila]|nr:ATP-binding protein [Alteromonas halophila]